MCPACKWGLNIVHVEPKKKEMGENAQKCAHSWLGQMEDMSDLDQCVPQNWNQMHCSEHTFWASAKLPWIWECQVYQVNP